MYQDQLRHGTPEQRNEHHFALLDVDKNKQLNKEEYIKFQLRYVKSMASIFSYHLDIKNIESASAMTYDIIAKNDDGTVRDYMTKEDLFRLK